MRPVAFVVYWAAFAQLLSMNKVCGLTNGEFYDLIKDYVTDVEVIDIESDGIDDYLQDDKDDVINLRGGPDDEIDLEYIVDKLGLIHDDNNGEDTDDYLQDDNDEDTRLPGGPDNELDVEYIADEQDVEVLGNETDVTGDFLQDGTEDLIYLQGGINDELDAEYIKDQRGLTSNDKVDLRRYRRRRNRRHRRRHHRRRRHRRRRHRRRHCHHHSRRRHHRRRRRRSGIGCYCERDSCSCCLKHTFRVNLIFKRLRFRLHACVTVAYLRSNIGFEVSFTINGRRLFHREISLKHPPPLCFGVPGLKYFARVCLEFYNINLQTKQVCARLAGILDLWIKQFRVHLKLGCFRIPILDEKALTNLLNDEDFLSACVLESGAGSKAVDLSDLFTIDRLLQPVQGDEDSNDV